MCPRYRLRNIKYFALRPLKQDAQEKQYYLPGNGIFGAKREE